MIMVQISQLAAALSSFTRGDDTRETWTNLREGPRKTRLFVLMSAKADNWLSLSRWVVWLLVLLAFVWRIEGLDKQSLWRDEVDAVYFALGDLRQLLSMFVEPGHNGALYYASLRPYLRLVGSSEFALRYPSLLLGVLSIPLMWQVSRRLLPATLHAGPSNSLVRTKNRWRFYLKVIISDPGLLATSFLAVSPYQLWYSQEGKMYTATTLIVLIATWFWLNGLERRSDWRSWLGLFIVVALGLSTHLLLALLLPLLGVWFLIAYRRHRSRAMGLLLASSAVITVYAYQSSWIWQLFTSSKPQTGRPFVPLSGTLQETLYYQLNGVMSPKNGGIWLLPLLILAASGVLYGYRVLSKSIRRPAGLSGRERQLLVISWLLLPILAIYAVSLRQPIFAPRYIIWIAPALMMVLALGVQLLKPQRSIWRGWLATLMVAYVVGYGLATGWQQKKTPIKYDLRSAVAYISQRRQPGELLILHIPHLEYAYRYYSGDQGARPFEGDNADLGWWAGGLWTNNELTDSEAVKQVEKEMEALTHGATDIWVMRSEVELWDARDLMDQWLREHGQLVEEVAFTGAQVTHYRVTPFAR